MVRRGLIDGSLGFGGEESAGASFLRRDGTVWTTDKDGIMMGLLAAEITAATGRDPGRALRDADGASSARRLRAHRCPGHAGAEEHAVEARPPEQLGADGSRGRPDRAR